MATIQAIDIIKGISGKYGNKSNDYFATNKSSNPQIRNYAPNMIQKRK